MPKVREVVGLGLGLGLVGMIMIMIMIITIFNQEAHVRVVTNRVLSETFVQNLF